MFTQIKTSLENRENVAQLTRKLGLGTENVIARIAFSYSLSKGTVLDLKDIENSSGKGYSKSVLFGDYADIYIGMICTHYQLYKTDKDIPKYIKMHVDDGLYLLKQEVEEQTNVEGFDFLSELINNKLNILI